MRQIKKLLSAALCAAVLFSAAGCGEAAPEGGSNPGGKGAPLGRYVEDQIELPTIEGGQNGSAIRANPDGSLDYYATKADADGNAESILRYHSADGSSWEEHRDPWLQELLESETGIRLILDAASGPDGTAWLLLNDKKGQPRLYTGADPAAGTELPIPSWLEPAPTDPSGGGSVTIGGEAEASGEVDVDSGEGSGGPVPQLTAGMAFGPNQLLILENGDPVVNSFDSGAQRLDGRTGELVQRYELPYARALASGGGRLYGLDPINDEILAFSLDTGAPEDPIPLKGSVASSAGSMLMGPDGALYVANSGGIHRVAAGGGLWETIMDGKLSFLNSPSQMLSKILPAGRDSYYLLYDTDSDGYRLTCCRYDATMPTQPDTELTVYSLHENSTVRQAITEFQLQNPLVMVNYQVGVDGESSATEEDVIRALNTEILAGRGPDVLLLDSLPIDSLIEKGVLADLGGIMQELGGSLFQNVAGTFTRDGGTYAIPARVKAPMLFGAEDLVENIRSLADIAADEGKKPFLQLQSASELLRSLVSSSYPAWLDASGKPDAAALTSFLQDAKSVWEKYQPKADDNLAVSVHSSVSFGNSGFAFTSGYFNFKMNGAARIYFTDLAGLGELELLLRPSGAITFTIVGQEPGTPAEDPDQGKPIGLKNMVGQSNDVYIPSTIAGVNAAGKQKELAESFVRMLLSNEVQKYNFYDGFPVNRDSLQKQMDKMKASYEKRGESFPITENPAGFLEALRTPCVTDGVFVNAVLENGEKVLAGEKSVEQAVKDIQTKTELYLAE